MDRPTAIAPDAWPVALRQEMTAIGRGGGGTSRRTTPASAEVRAPASAGVRIGEDAMAKTGLDTVERTIGDLRVAIDRSLCVGFAQCVDVAAEAFEVGDDDVVEFVSPEQVSRDRLIQACTACPVEALKAFDSGGTQLVP